MTKAQAEEREQRLIEALLRFRKQEETEDDLALICYETGLTNFRPPKDRK